MTAYLVGTCCCNATIYQSVRVYLATTMPMQPITSGRIYLYINTTGTTQNDLNLALDITPVADKTVEQAYPLDFTLNIIESGQITGRLVYHYVSGPDSPLQHDYFCNITVYYGGYVYRAEGITASFGNTPPPDGSIDILRTPVTATPGA